MNRAHAYARCADCRAVAVAFQVVLANRAPANVAADNAAVAVNEACERYEAVAIAYQCRRRERPAELVAGAESVARGAPVIPPLSHVVPRPTPRPGPGDLASPAMMRPQPLIAVADVQAGSRWFQQVLGLTSGHGGPNYEMLLDGGEIAAHLHQWEADEHPHIGNPHDPSRGNGVLLWFSTDDFDAAVERVRANDATILDGPLLNPNSRQREVWVRGPEGYVVVVSGPRESA